MEYSRPLAFFSAMQANEQAVAGFQRDLVNRLQAESMAELTYNSCLLNTLHACNTTLANRQFH